MNKMLLLFATLFILFGVVISSPSLNIVANVRGKRFEVAGETVHDISKQVETLTGIKVSEQNIMYKGKILGFSDKLHEVGLCSGEVVNVVKGKKVRNKTKDSLPASSPIENEKLRSSFDPEGFNADPEKLKEAMAAMDSLLDSNAIEEYFSDDDRIEEARQQMLANMEQYETMMPGFKEQASEIASDPIKWKEAMNNAKLQLLKMKEQRDAMRSKKEQPQNPADTR